MYYNPTLSPILEERMKPTTLTIFELFERERRYIVPLFQRPYVWSQDRQWEPLWEDIVTKADEILEQSDNDYRQLRNHFLGAVVLNQIKTFGRQVSAAEVIDGQQRLTTLQVLLVALRDFIRATGQDSLNSTLGKLTNNNGRLDQKYEQYKVWPTTTDRGVFEAVFEAGSPDALIAKFPQERIKYTRRYTPRPRLVDAYLYFYQAISAYTASTDDNETDNEDAAASTISIDRLEALIEALTRYLELVVIELEERDDPQIIFETLNARGEPLLPSDLIRNFVFLEATRRGDDVDRLYNTYWHSFDESGNGSGNTWKTIERQGRLTRPRIDLFFFHYLIYQTDNDLLITHVFQEFRDWWNRLQPKVEDELKKLKLHANVFQSLFEADSASRRGVFAKRLRILDTSTMYPLLLFLLGEKKDDLPEAERDQIITYLESYVVRRMICGLTTKNYNRVFLTLLRDLRKADHVSSSEVARLLLNLQGDTVRWPTDEEFRQCWLTNPVYQTLTTRRVAMVLEALDLQLHTSKQEQLHITAPLSVEHVMPQTPSDDDWPLPIADEADEQTRLDALARRTQLTQTFGNLTLLTQALNSSISNGPFVNKQPEITKQSLLRLNAYFQQFSNGGQWTEEAIIQRGEELFKLAQVIWLRPSNT